MAKRPTSIKQVADAAGVSTATVSNVFSGKKPVKPELAAKVRETASRLGYHVNRAASNLRSGQSRIVPVMVPDLSDPFFTSLITEIEALGEADDFDIIVASSKDDAETEKRRIAALLSWQPAGMIIVPSSDAVPQALIAARDSMPIILTDRGVGVQGFDVVLPDNLDAGRQAGAHLAGLGHRRVLIAASDLRLQAIQDRCDGVTEQIEAAGGTTDVLAVGPKPGIGATRLSEWLDANMMPSAVFATTDMTTLSLLSCLAERGIDVGSDVSVVGFDDYPWMSARRTPITAVRQPVEAMAEAIWSTLKSRLTGQEPASANANLKCTLLIRASTRPAHDARKEALNGTAGTREAQQRASG